MNEYPKIYQDHRGYAVPLTKDGPWVTVGGEVAGPSDNKFLLPADVLGSYYFSTEREAEIALLSYKFQVAIGIVKIANVGEGKWITNI